MEHWLPFVSTLIWQIILVVALLMFKSELSLLFKRIARLRHGDTEVEFQKSSSEALETAPIATEVLALRDEYGFFTLQGIYDLVNTSKYLGPDEKTLDAILVFSTETQHTWLVSTDSQVFFILDDERTRATQRLIQRRALLSSTRPVQTQQESESSGSFRLGTSDWWYYSIALVGSPEPARRRLESFLKTTEANK